MPWLSRGRNAHLQRLASSQCTVWRGRLTFQTFQADSTQDRDDRRCLPRRIRAAFCAMNTSSFRWPFCTYRTHKMPGLACIGPRGRYRLSSVRSPSRLCFPGRESCQSSTESGSSGILCSAAKPKSHYWKTWLHFRSPSICGSTGLNRLELQARAQLPRNFWNLQWHGWFDHLSSGTLPCETSLEHRMSQYR